MADEEKREEYVSRGPIRRQVRKRRKDGWTERDIEIFLDHYRVTANITASAKAAGKSASGVFRLRATDAGFAERMDSALGEADVRLRSKVAVFAETKGKPVAKEGGEPEEAPMEDFDPVIALKFLAHNRDRLGGGRQRGGARPKAASEAELNEALMKLLGMMKKRRAKQRASQRAKRRPRT
jgi:hypothetical protein